MACRMPGFSSEYVNPFKLIHETFTISKLFWQMLLWKNIKNHLLLWRSALKQGVTVTIKIRYLRGKPRKLPNTCFLSCELARSEFKLRTANWPPSWERLYFPYSLFYQFKVLWGRMRNLQLILETIRLI